MSNLENSTRSKTFVRALAIITLLATFALVFGTLAIVQLAHAAGGDTGDNNTAMQQILATEGESNDKASAGDTNSATATLTADESSNSEDNQSDTTLTAQTVYRLYNPITSEHLFATDISEYNFLVDYDWIQEGKAWDSLSTGSTPVYRLYNPVLGEMQKMSHHYTTDKTEADYLVANWGWVYDGDSAPLFYSAQGSIGNALQNTKNDVLQGAQQVYRLYNGGLSAHLYTLDSTENDSLTQNEGWSGEGTGFYAYPDATSTQTDSAGTTLVADPSNKNTFIKAKVTVPGSKSGEQMPVKDATVTIDKGGKVTVTLPVGTPDEGVEITLTDPTTNEGIGGKNVEILNSDKTSLGSITTDESGKAALTTPIDITNAKVATAIFNGEQQQPTITIDGLTEKTDFTVEYGANINAGTGAGSATIKGIGKYSGEKTLTFDIEQKEVGIEWSTIGTSASPYATEYDTQTHNPTVTITGTAGADSLTVTPTYTLAGTPATDIKGAGTYTATVSTLTPSTSTTASNYKLPTTADGNVDTTKTTKEYTINKATPTVTVSAGTSANPVTLLQNAELTTITFAGDIPTITPTAQFSPASSSTPVTVAGTMAWDTTDPSYINFKNDGSITSNQAVKAKFTPSSPDDANFNSVDVDIYVKILKTYTVTFNSNGGSAVESETVQQGNNAIKPAIVPTNDGYTFAGWFTDKDCTEGKVAFDEYGNSKVAITQDTTYYAKWTPTTSAKADADGEVILTYAKDGADKQYYITVSGISTKDGASTALEGTVVSIDGSGNVEVKLVDTTEYDVTVTIFDKKTGGDTHIANVPVTVKKSDDTEQDSGKTGDGTNGTVRGAFTAHNVNWTKTTNGICKCATTTTKSGTCIVCENAVTNTIEPTGHKKNPDASADPYQANGVSYKCSECGHVIFGHYDQDDATSATGTEEEICWVELEAGNALASKPARLISLAALDCKQYNTTLTSVTWETCTLRKWLNGSAFVAGTSTAGSVYYNDDCFYDTAFTTAEQAKIATTAVANADNGSIKGGNNTQDKVFLLSIDEATSYFSSDVARKCHPTTHTINAGAYSSDRTVSTKGTQKGFCYWWLRSPSNSVNKVTNVDPDTGAISSDANIVTYTEVAVRPTLDLMLS